MKMTGAAALIECLAEQGVDTVFGYPGGVILPFYDALYRRPSRIRHILTTHEQNAAHAADGYARASGKTGVCVATSGPGATNLVTGLAAAFMDSIPVVAITGQVDTPLLGHDAFQEVDIVGVTMPITKHNFQIKDATKLPRMIRLAFQIAAAGRPGPVLVDIPRDVLAAEIDFEPAGPEQDAPRGISADLSAAIDAAVRVINAAERPVVIAGGGVISAEAAPELTAFIKQAQLPVASTLMGLGAYPQSDAQFLGLTGMHGWQTANRAVHRADVVVAVGSRFSDRLTGNRIKYSDDKTIIHIDIDPAEIDKNIVSHIGLDGDMKAILNRLTAGAARQDRADWREQIRAWQKQFAFPYDETQLNAPWVMHCLNELAAPGETIFVTDVGQHQMWAAQHLSITRPRTWLTSGGLGCMGFGLPAAMGACLGAPGKRVVHIAGDGGMRMTGSELYTVAALRLPLLSIIVNNHGLGMIRQLQRVFYDRHYFACDLEHKMDFPQYAQSFGVPGAAVRTPQEFRRALQEALADDGPRLIEVHVASDFVRPMAKPGAAIDQFVDLSDA